MHPTHGYEHMKNCIETRAPWMAKEQAQLYLHDFCNLDLRRLWLSPAELREKVWLSNADRERLRAWNIPPFDALHNN
jgi:hypothetical protein